MMKGLSNLLLVAILAAMPVAQAADIVGTITFQGVPPAEVDIGPKMAAESPDCAAMYDPAKMPTTHFYVVGTNGAFADVVVSLQGMDGKSTGASAPAVLLDQKGCLYTPTILAMQTNQKLIVRNSDSCTHNVHCLPTVPGNEEHNDPQMSGGADLAYTFAKPEMFLKFQCDVHSWMFAWVSVFDHPYFCVSGADGRFTIKNVPPGKYTIAAAHRKAGTQTQAVAVADKDATVNFTFEAK
jgi:Carboxypeptidase regulatory-like domain